MAIGVLHLTDTLDAGGAERVAVNLVNLLPRSEFSPHLCTTRREGVLSTLVNPDVGRLALNRKWTVDVRAFRNLVRYIRKHDIKILHAHSSAIFIAVCASLLPPFPRVLWHDHFGGFNFEQRRKLFYWLATRRTRGVVSVTNQLAEWARTQLQIEPQRIWYAPNFVVLPPSLPDSFPLPGVKGKRIVCVANLRRQKDHLTLVRAMAIVKDQAPGGHLFFVGAASDPECVHETLREIKQLNLSDNVTLLGQIENVSAILAGCDIGVLSSRSEGLPLALIEYGWAGLATVSTEVGQCAEVLRGGEVGVLVPPSQPEALARALIDLLNSPDRRSLLGRLFRQHVEEQYSYGPIIERICSIYRELL